MVGTAEVRKPGPPQGLCSVSCCCFLLVLFACAVITLVGLSCWESSHRALWTLVLALLLTLPAGIGLILAIVYYFFDNELQTWALQHPKNPISRIFLPIFTLSQGLQSCNNAWLHSRRLRYGSTFCCAGQLCLGELQAIQAALLAPQARTFRLGQTPLLQGRCPMSDDGRNTLLIAMSDAGAGGNGDHERYRKCFEEFFIKSPGVKRRLVDETARKMVEQLARDYVDLPSKSFFRDRKCAKGLEAFLIRFLHHAFFGLDLQGKDLTLMTKLYAGDLPTLHFIHPFGYLMNRSNLVKDIAQVYESSPALHDFQESTSEFGSMTKRGLSRMMVAIIRLAAKTGTYQLARAAMGDETLPSYKGERTGSVDVLQHWDALDLEDEEVVRRYVLEVARLFPPVNCIHHIATEALTVPISGKSRTFPAGTPILVPLLFGNLDHSVWGSTAFAFDPLRPELDTNFLGFNSVGDQHSGRICPGRQITLDILVVVLQVVGRARRRQFAGLPPVEWS